MKDDNVAEFSDWDKHNMKISFLDKFSSMSIDQMAKEWDSLRHVLSGAQLASVERKVMKSMSEKQEDGKITWENKVEGLKNYNVESLDSMSSFNARFGYSQSGGEALPGTEKLERKIESGYKAWQEADPQAYALSAKAKRDGLVKGVAAEENQSAGIFDSLKESVTSVRATKLLESRNGTKENNKQVDVAVQAMRAHMAKVKQK